MGRTSSSRIASTEARFPNIISPKIEMKMAGKLERDQELLYLFRVYFVTSWRKQLGKIHALPNNLTDPSLVACLGFWSTPDFQKLANEIDNGCQKYKRVAVHLTRICLPKKAATILKGASERIISDKPLRNMFRDEPQNGINVVFLNAMLWACQGKQEPYSDWNHFKTHVPKPRNIKQLLQSYIDELQLNVRQNQGPERRTGFMPELLPRLRMAVRDHYQTHPMFREIPLVLSIGSDDCVLEMGEYFVELSYFSGKTRLQKQELEQHEKRNSRSSHKFQPVLGKDYLSIGLLSEQNRAVIIGGPGSGKSTFARQLCSQYSLGKLMQHGEIMVYMEAKKYHTFETEPNALWHTILNTFALVDGGEFRDLDKIEKFVYDSVYLVVDGFDELELSLQQRLVRELDLKCPRYLLLSRPYALAAHRGLARQVIAEIDGFNESTRRRYVELIWGKFADSTTNLEPKSMIELIDSNPVLSEASYNPLMLSYLTQLMLFGQMDIGRFSSISSQFELQSHVEDMIAFRNKERFDSILNKDFHSVWKSAVRNASLVACKMESRREMVLSVAKGSEAEVQILEICEMGLGNCGEQVSILAKMTFQFLTASLQEFYAAKRIGLWASSRELESLSSDPYYWNLLRLVIGNMEINGRMDPLIDMVNFPQNGIASRVIRNLVLGEMAERTLTQVLGLNDYEGMLELYLEVYWMPLWEPILVDALSRVYSKIRSKEREVMAGVFTDRVVSMVLGLNLDSPDPQKRIETLCRCIKKIGINTHPFAVNRIVESLLFLQDRLLGIDKNSKMTLADLSHPGAIRGIARTLLEVIEEVPVDLLMGKKEVVRSWAFETNVSSFGQEVAMHIVQRMVSLEDWFAEFDAEFARFNVSQDWMAFPVHLVRSLGVAASSAVKIKKMEALHRLKEIGLQWERESENLGHLETFRTYDHFPSLIASFQDLLPMGSSYDQEIEKICFSYAWRFHHDGTFKRQEPWIDYLVSKVPLLPSGGRSFNREQLETLNELGNMLLMSSEKGYYLSRMRNELCESCCVLIKTYLGYISENPPHASYNADADTPVANVPSESLAMMVLNNVFGSVSFDFDRQYFVQSLLNRFDYQTNSYLRDIALPMLMGSQMGIRSTEEFSYLQHLFDQQRYDLLVKILANRNHYVSSDLWDRLLEIWNLIAGVSGLVNPGLLDQFYFHLYYGLRWFLECIYESPSLRHKAGFCRDVCRVATQIFSNGAIGVHSLTDRPIFVRGKGTSLFSRQYLYLLQVDLEMDLLPVPTGVGDVLLDADLQDGQLIRLEFLNIFDLDEILTLRPWFSQNGFDEIIAHRDNLLNAEASRLKIELKCEGT